jgi:ferrous iron transport protein A
VVRVVVPGSPVTARRLVDLGFTRGTAVRVLRRAPLRDPVVYRVKDYELCLRRAQAACVEVEVDR